MDVPGGIPSPPVIGGGGGPGGGGRGVPGPAPRKKDKKKFLISFEISLKISVRDWKVSHTNKVQKLLLF